MQEHDGRGVNPAIMPIFARFYLHNQKLCATLWSSAVQGGSAFIRSFTPKNSAEEFPNECQSQFDPL